MNDLNKLKGYNSIIFDFDGTIAKIVIEWSGWHEFTEKFFKSYDPEIKYVRSTEVHRIQNDLVKRFGIEISKKMSEFNGLYEYNNIQSLIPNKELINYIKENSDKKHYSIVSNQNRYLLDKLLKDLKINGLFDQIITRDDVTFIKPDPEGILKIVNTSGKLGDYIYVGDAKIDEDVAKNIGIDFEYVSIPS